MWLISFIDFMMSFFVRLSKMLRVYMLEKVKTIFYFLWSPTKTGR